MEEPFLPHTGRGHFKLWSVSLVVSLSSFLFGYNLTALNACLEKHKPGSLLNDIPLTDFEQEIASTLVILGAWVGCVFASGPAETHGRRPVLLVNNIFFVVGAGLCCGIVSKWVLFVGRFVIGIGTGVECNVVPILLAELAPVQLRGTITSLHQLSLTIGILVSGLTGYVFVTYVTAGWRYVMGLAAVFSGLQLLLMSLVPESPRWLVQTNQPTKARFVMVTIWPSEYTNRLDEEVQTIQDALASQKGEMHATWSETIRESKPMVIGMGLMFFSAMGGINAVMLYSTTIFGYSGVNQAIIATVSVGAVNVLLTVVSTYLVDRVGRKVLLMTGNATMVVSLGVLGFVLLYMNSDETLQGIISVAAVLVMVCGYAVGMGAVQWVVMNEIVPTRIRSKAFSVFMSANWMMNLLIGLCTLTVIDALGGGSSDSQQKRGVALLFLIFGVISFLGTVFIQVLVPETKGQALQ
jgi:sugar porter (SP) family MFS transporter